MNESDLPKYLPGIAAMIIIFTIISAILGIAIASWHKSGILGILAFLAAEATFIYLIHELFVEPIQIR